MGAERVDGGVTEKVAQEEGAMQVTGFHSEPYGCVGWRGRQFEDWNRIPDSVKEEAGGV
jgi:hypothetical protein